MTTENQAGNNILLSAMDIFTGGDIPFKPLEIPELTKDGKVGMVYLKAPSAGDVLDFAAKSADTNTETQHDALIRMIAQCVVDQDGKRLFQDETRVREIPFSIFSRLMAAVNDLAGIGKKEEAGKG